MIVTHLCKNILRSPLSTCTINQSIMLKLLFQMYNMFVFTLDFFLNSNIVNFTKINTKQVIHTTYIKDAVVFTCLAICIKKISIQLLTFVFHYCRSIVLPSFMYSICVHCYMYHFIISVHVQLYIYTL